MILQFKPVFFQKVWGGNKLNEYFGYEANPGCGEAWGISAHSNGSSIIKNTIYKGKTLRELFESNKELFGNYTGEEFPILIKIIDAKTDLSIQVHPDNEYALKNHNSFGKDECWYILEANPNTKIIIGHLASSREELAEHIEDNTIKHILNRFKIKKGDSFYLEAGTLHSICANTLLLEVQQSSDITYRVFDYNRLSNGKLRELHIDKALDVIKAPDSAIIELPKNTYFKFNIFDNKLSNTYISSIHGDYITVLEGEGLFDEIKVKKGDFLMVTSLQRYTIKGNLKYQKTTF